MSDLTRLIDRQYGLVARRQLSEHGVHWDDVRTQERAGRCRIWTPRVLSTVTGELTTEQRRWLAVLHAGPRAMLGGLTAAEHLGLRRWERAVITVIVDDELAFEPVEGIDFFRSRRSFELLIDPEADLPTCRLEPAILMWAGYDAPPRAAHADCEWDLRDGSVLVLEIDGSFHMEVEHWGDDKKRSRRLTTRTRTVIGCTASEVRHEPGEVAHDLIALGVPVQDSRTTTADAMPASWERER